MPVLRGGVCTAQWSPTVHTLHKPPCMQNIASSPGPLPFLRATLKSWERGPGDDAMQNTQATKSQNLLSTTIYYGTRN